MVQRSRLVLSVHPWLGEAPELGRLSAWGGAAVLTSLAWLALATSLSADEQQVTDLGELPVQDATAGDLFGSAVSIGELHSAVGAPGCDDVADGAGAVYLYARSAGGWAATQKLLPPEAQGDERFGSSLDLDGDRLVVGAPGAEGEAPGSGAAYLYRFDGQTWTLARRIAARDGLAGEEFGASVAVAGDSLFVGAPRRRVAGAAVGGAFTFALSGDDSGVARELRGQDSGAGDLFGWHVASDGRSLLVGAPGHGAAGAFSGASYVFERSPAGWVEVAKLEAANAAAGAVFGSSGSVAGERLCVGAPSESSVEFLSGAVYVFRRGSSGWREQSLLKAEPAHYGARFGHATHLAGGTLVVGARLDPTPVTNAGAVLVFRDGRDGWALREELGELQPGFNHGYGAALDSRHGELLVGAPRSSWVAQDSGSTQALSVQPGSGSCAGDGSAGVCPCGNFAGLGRGCRHSGGVGVRLFGEGSSRVADDDLELHVLDAPPGSTVVLFVSREEQAAGQGLPFGDGLLCTGGELRRLGLRPAGPAGGATWAPAELSSLADWSPGETRVFQALYRDIDASPCNTGFNTSNAYRVEFEL